MKDMHWGQLGLRRLHDLTLRIMQEGPTLACIPAAHLEQFRRTGTARIAKTSLQSHAVSLT